MAMVESKFNEAFEAFYYGMGINPKSGEAYVAYPDKMAVDNRDFLTKWFDALPEETQELIKNPPKGPTMTPAEILAWDNKYGKTEGYKEPVEQGSNWTKEDWNDYHDVIVKPAHYNTGAIEAIYYLEDNMPVEAFIGYLEGSVKKYLHRWRYKKAPLQDLEKALWYQKRLVWKMKGNMLKDMVDA